MDGSLRYPKIKYEDRPDVGMDDDANFEPSDIGQKLLACCILGLAASAITMTLALVLMVM